jgi:hypothetical protein
VAFEGKVSSLAQSIVRKIGAMNEQKPAATRPNWLSDALLRQTVQVYRSKSSAAFGEDEAVELLVTLGQILAVMGTLDFEVKSEDE